MDETIVESGSGESTLYVKENANRYSFPCTFLQVHAKRFFLSVHETPLVRMLILRMTIGYNYCDVTRLNVGKVS